ncbi:MAG: RluA family pseudouridine synthase [Candidatus Handelsmanbacteria bacterium]|nr:RluA family pseudouridine synthase [Candidatus Handelsmanbacteria bacterium]
MKAVQVNEGCAYRERLGPEAEGQTLLEYLSRCYTHSTAAAWAERIAAGRVRLDGEAGRADSPLRRGSELVWDRPPWTEPSAPRSFAVLHEDEDLLAVAKPAGLPTLPGAGFLQATLLHQVQRRDSAAAPVHRLGRWTSGVVLCARNPAARASLTRQWATGQVRKSYQALANGCPTWKALEISAPIGPVPHPLLGQVHAASPTGKRAHSRVHVVERRADAFLCEVEIPTGRPHQIRIHLAAAGHPLVGDPLYMEGGLPAPDSRAVPGDPGYQLHAAELCFCHPRTGRDVVIECAPPLPLRTTNPEVRPR